MIEVIFEKLHLSADLVKTVISLFVMKITFTPVPDHRRQYCSF